MAGCGSSHEDQDETSCPICIGDIPSDIVERIIRSAGQQGPRMSVEEFRRWLDGVGRDAAGDR